MAPSNQTLTDDSSRVESPAILFIEEQNSAIQVFWRAFGCIGPILLFWLGALFCGALAGW